MGTNFDDIHPVFGSCGCDPCACETIAYWEDAYTNLPNHPAAQWESFDSSYRPLSHGGWFIGEDGEIL
jgi:hypothetical protein